MKTYNTGIIGFGFIGRVHAWAHGNLPYFYQLPFRTKLLSICTAHQETADAGRELVGAGQGVIDFRKITEDPDIDIVHICSPNSAHLDQILSAMENGKHIYCDKPLTATLKEAEEIEKALPGYRGKFGMTFQNRFFPSVMRAGQLVENGFLGRPLTFRAAYLHAGSADPSAPRKWKLSEEAGGGVINDLGSHIVDLVRYLVGDFRQLSAVSQIPFPYRPDPKDPDRMLPVDAEEHVMAIAECSRRDQPDSIITGTLEATKLASGTEDELRLEIHGTEGAIRLNTMDPHHLQVYRAKENQGPLGGMRGWTRIDSGQRYPEPAVAFPGPKFSIGWIRSHLANLAEFLLAVDGERAPSPDVQDGLAVQRVLYTLRQSSERGGWMEVPSAQS